MVDSRATGLPVRSTMSKGTFVAPRRRRRSSATASTASTGAAVSAAVNSRGSSLSPPLTTRLHSAGPSHQPGNQRGERQPVTGHGR